MKSVLCTLSRFMIAPLALLSSAFFLTACGQNSAQESMANAVDYHDSFIQYKGTASANVVSSDWVHFDAKAPGGFTFTEAPAAVAPTNAQTSELLTDIANSYMPLVLLDRMKGIASDETTASYTIEVSRLTMRRFSDEAILQSSELTCLVFAEVRVIDKSGALRYWTGNTEERMERYCRYDGNTMVDMVYAALDGAMEKIKVVGP